MKCFEKSELRKVLVLFEIGCKWRGELRGPLVQLTLHLWGYGGGRQNKYFRPTFLKQHTVADVRLAQNQ